jgi:HEAT repeats/Putative zinc-finger
MSANINDRNFNRNLGDGMDGQPCAAWESLLVLFAAGGELDPAEHAGVSAHLMQCPACSAALDREKHLVSLLAGEHAEPDAALLASCRAGLQDALDRGEERGWLHRSLGWLVPSSWLTPRPAWSAAVLLLIGFSVGVLGPRYLRHSPAAVAPDSGSAASNASPSDASSPGDSAANISDSSSPLPALDWRSADVAGINLVDSGGSGDPSVELQMRSQRPVTVKGAVDDDNVKRVLLGVLGGGDRFCADVRLSAVDCLRASRNDPDVRSALCKAVRTDRNPAVRLKALEALDGAEPQDIVRQTLLDALVEDSNPGVRIEAINSLRDMTARGQLDSDDHTLSVLRERTRKDPNTYIRLQSAEVIRDLGPREKF